MHVTSTSFRHTAARLWIVDCGLKTEHWRSQWLQCKAFYRWARCHTAVSDPLRRDKAWNAIAIHWSNCKSKFVNHVRLRYARKEIEWAVHCLRSLGRIGFSIVRSLHWLAWQFKWIITLITMIAWCVQVWDVITYLIHFLSRTDWRWDLSISLRCAESTFSLHSHFTGLPTGKLTHFTAHSYLVPVMTS